MAQSLLTIDMITNKALEILENNLVITRNVNRQYDDSFAVEGAKIGDTLRIRLPDRALVTDGAALQVQEVQQQFVKPRNTFGTSRVKVFCSHQVQCSNPHLISQR